MPALRKRQPETHVAQRARARARGVQRSGYRALTASAAEIDMADRQQAQRMRSLRTRSAWQLDAWEYRRRIGELRYAVAYLGNSIMRLQLFPGVFVDNGTAPVHVDEAPNVIPSDLASAAVEVLQELGNGSPTGSAQLMKKLTENYEVAGECYLLGQTDPITRQDTFAIRSVSEIIIDPSGRYGVREDPSVSATVGMSNEGVEWLNPDNTWIERLWWPDPEWSKLADSPIRSVMDTLDELSLLSLDVRATARSRLANNGVLLVPEGLTVVRNNSVQNLDGTPDNEEEIDEFLEELLDTATAALTNEGSAAAAVPILLRGPAEALAAIKHIIFARPADARNASQRMELIGRLATGLDLPAEVLTGKADLNHWTGWQIDDDSFRHHVEPMAQVEVDSLTAGYLWKALDAEQRWDPALVRRIVVWYDPTELVTHPDRSGDAKDAFDRGAIGRKSLRDYLGMPESDAPDEFDEILYTLTKARGVDPTLLTALLKAISTQSKIQIPDVPAQPDPKVPGGSDGPIPPVPGAPTPAPTNPDDPSRNQPGPPNTQPPGGSGGSGASTSRTIRERLNDAKLDALLASMTAAASQKKPTPRSQSKLLSKKLAEIDRRTRDRLHAAANITLRRVMDRAGSRIVSKSRTAAGAPVRDRLQGLPAWRIPMTMRPAEFAVLGIDESNIIDDQLSDMQDTYFDEVSKSTDAAASIVAELSGQSKDDVLAATRHQLDQAHQRGWDSLQKSLTDRAKDLVSSLDEEDLADAPELADAIEAAGISLPFGAVRAAVALAGGYGTGIGDQGLNDNGTAVDGGYLGGIGNGDIFSGFLTDAGLGVTGYVWEHGPSDFPFEPHLDLDGYEFSDFTDDGLAVQGDFPDTGYYTPGDHDGCTCDLVVSWAGGSGDGEDVAPSSGDEVDATDEAA